MIVKPDARSSPETLYNSNHRLLGLCFKKDSPIIKILCVLPLGLPEASGTKAPSPVSRQDSGPCWVNTEQVLAWNLSFSQEMVTLPTAPRPTSSRDTARCIRCVYGKKIFRRVSHFFNLSFLSAERTPEKKNVICLGQWKRKTGVYFCLISKMQTTKRKLWFSLHPRLVRAEVCCTAVNENMLDSNPDGIRRYAQKRGRLVKRIRKAKGKKRSGFFFLF